MTVSLTVTPPADVRVRKLSMVAWLLLKTYMASGFSRELTKLIASSSSRTVMIGSTGPKI